MIARERVEAAFHWLLGRAPENEAAVRYHMGLANEAALRRSILASPEFTDLFHQARTAPADALVGNAPLAAPAVVETEADGAVLDALWSRVAGAWAGMGERAHWSVLTFDAFAPDRLDDNREVFAATAEGDARLVDRALARFPEVDPAGLDCVEYGAGVGRVTTRLADRFRRVTALDVSAPHLAHAEAALAGRANTACRRVGALADLDALEPYGFLYSRLVLQHNPPPLQAAILSRLFDRLAPGGIALFQVATRIEGYAYSVEADRTAPGAMEMHVLPQRAVFERLARAGLAPVEAVPDDLMPGDRRFSFTLFLAHRP
ncbi:MAG: methyltransferase domain-containing protein [Paracoccaceae bacterium]